MKHISKFLFIGILLEIVVLILSYVEANGSTTHFFQAAARLSGRVSLLFFGMLFVYATVFPLVEPGSEPLRLKFIMARNFTIIHIIHFFLLATAVKLSGFELVPTRVAGGALAYLMIVLFPFILKRKLFTSLSLRWGFHFYLAYVWLIFFITYLTRVLGKASPVTGSMFTYQVLLFIVSILMLWRISFLIKKQLTPDSSMS
jgi:hypothetical protein